MEIEILARNCGGTEFLAQPHRLHLGARQAEGVDRLLFRLPAAWKGLAVTLYIEHSDGTSPSPISLDSENGVTVDRRFTGWPEGKWMLTATDGAGYTAFTRPGTYDVHEVITADGSADEPSTTLYEQFVASVLESANQAAASAKSAAESAALAQSTGGSSEALARLSARVAVLEQGGTSSAGNSFAYTFVSLSGLTVTGTWNEAGAQLEF